MNKIKMNTGLASIMLIASLFAGWQTLLLVTLFMFIFCEVEEKVKDVAVKVITFFVGYTIVTTGWNILMSGIGVATGGVTSVVSAINSYLDYADQLDATKLVGLISAGKSIVDGIVSIMFSLIKLGFVISVLTGQPSKKNSMSAKIDEYVNKALNYVSGNVAVNMNMNPAQPMASGAQQPMQQAMPQQPMNPTQPVKPVQPTSPVQPVQPVTNGQMGSQNVNPNNGNQQ